MMSARPTPRYNAVAQALHWLLALGIVGMLILGLVMTHAGLPRLQVFKLYQAHKSIGITILIVALLRLLWRLTHRPPDLPEHMPEIEKRGAHAAHVILYMLMIGMPLVGWAMVSVSPFNIPTVLFGVVPWPHMPGLSSISNKPYWEGVAKFVHAYGAYALIALIALHALAALRHHFVLHDDILLRMLPRGQRAKSSDVKA